MASLIEQERMQEADCIKLQIRSSAGGTPWKAGLKNGEYHELSYVPLNVLIP